MKKCFISSSCFPKTTVSKAVEIGGELSEKHVELSAPHKFQETTKIKKDLIFLEEQGYILSLHNYFPPPRKDFVLNIATSDANQRKMAHELILTAAHLCSSLKTNLFGVHAGYLFSDAKEHNGFFQFTGEKIEYQVALKNSTDFVNSISTFFRENNIRLLIENLFPQVGGNNSLFCSYDQIKEFYQLVPEDVGLLLDLGHLNVTSNLWGIDREKFLEDILMNFSHKIFEIHLSENNGIADLHLAVLEKSWQLAAIEKIKKHLPNDIIYCLEARNSSTKEIKRSLELINNTIC